MMIHEPRLNQAQCNQAYSYWLAALDKTLYEIPSRGNRPEVLKAKNMGLKKEVDDKNKALAASKMQLMGKDDFLLEIKSSLSDLDKSFNEEEKTKKLNKLITKIENNLSGNKEWKAFENQFDLLHSDFFKKLKSDYPKLSIAEAKLCMLLKMKLSTKEIASQLNLSVRGVETRRYRLRKKLQLSKDQILEELLDRL